MTIRQSMIANRKMVINKSMILNNKKNMKNNTSVNHHILGFTFMELIICLAIIGIFIMVSYPMFNNAVYKTRRIDGQIGLLNLATKMRQYFVSHGSYLDVSIDVLDAKSVTGKGYYVLSIPAVYLTSNSFIVTATPQGDQQNDTDCGTIAINTFGAKGKMVAGQFVPDEDCWQ